MSKKPKVHRRLDTVAKLVEVLYELKKELQDNEKDLSQVLLLTDLGLVQLNDDSLVYTDESERPNSPIAVVMDVIEENEPSNDQVEYIGDGACFVVKNVDLIPLSAPNVKCHLDELLLFVDSVKGVTLGKLT